MLPGYGSYYSNGQKPSPNNIYLTWSPPATLQWKTRFLKKKTIISLLNHKAHSTGLCTEQHIGQTASTALLARTHSSVDIFHDYFAWIMAEFRWRSVESPPSTHGWWSRTCRHRPSTSFLVSIGRCERTETRIFSEHTLLERFFENLSTTPNRCSCTFNNALTRCFDIYFWTACYWTASGV